MYYMPNPSYSREKEEAAQEDDDDDEDEDENEVEGAEELKVVYIVCPLARRISLNGNSAFRVLCQSS